MIPFAYPLTPVRGLPGEAATGLRLDGRKPGEMAAAEDGPLMGDTNKMLAVPLRVTYICGPR